MSSIDEVYGKDYTETAFKSITEAKPPDKILSILELIEQAKQRQ